MNLFDFVDLLIIIAGMIGASALFGLLFARLLRNTGHHVAFVQNERVPHPYDGLHVRPRRWARRTS